MTTGNTTLLGLALPVEGELDGTWGDVVNDSITSLVDSAVAGTTTLSVDADVTLTTTALAANQARQAILLWTASNGATTRNITAPAQSKPYIVINAGTGSIVLRGAGPTTGITIVAGERCLAAWNGSDFVKVATSVAGGVTTFSAGTTGFTPSTGTSGAVTLAGTLNVANGGTGATSLTANNVILGNGTSAVQVVAPGTSGNVLTSNGTTWTSTTPSSQAYPGVGIALSTGTAWNTSITDSAGLAAALGDETGSGAAVFGTAPTLSGPTINDGYTEEIFAVTGTTPALSPTNGSIQTWTLSGNSTPTAGTWANGQSLTLMIDDGTAFTVTWSSLAVTWKTNGGSAPTLQTTGVTAIQLWKVGDVIYGARVGDA
jgi:hypothetical protein